MCVYAHATCHDAPAMLSHDTAAESRVQFRPSSPRPPGQLTGNVGQIIQPAHPIPVTTQKGLSLKIPSLPLQTTLAHQTVFSEQRRHVQPKCLCCLPWATPSQCQDVQQHHNLQRWRNQNPSKRKWTTCVHIVWISLVLGLAATHWMLGNRPSPTPHMLRMRKFGSRSSSVSSSTGSVMHAPPTTTLPGLPPCGTTTFTTDILLSPTPSNSASTQASPNSSTPILRLNGKSLDTFARAYEEIERNEFSKGRYLGPCSQRETETLIGPFQTSPLSIIAKPGKTGKFRAVHNFSAPHTPHILFASINSAIESDKFPCTWGTFNTIAFIISNLPPGSQASVRDVAEAYRTIPITASQWPGLVIRLQGQDRFAINTNDNFGLSSAGGIYGQLADAGTDIFRREGIGPISKWVDDHIFFRIQKQHLAEYNGKRSQWHQNILSNGGRRQEGSRIWFCGNTMEDGRSEEFDEDNMSPLRDLSTSPHEPFAYDDTIIDSLSNHLGIPWEATKTIPFGPVVPYLGLSWDLDTKTVALPDAKKQKYLACIEAWRDRPAHTLAQVQSLYGKLLHTCLVAREGRAYLTSLETMLGTSSHRPFVPHIPPHGTTEDLEWWVWTLHKPFIFRDVPGPSTINDFKAYSDASSGVGIGIVIGDRWRAWRLLPGWKADDREIGWAKAIGFEFLVRTLSAAICCSQKQHVKVFGDNRGVVEGWWKGRSRNKPTNQVFRRVHELEKMRRITIHSWYVASKQNPADNPSRGIYPSDTLLLPPIPIPAELWPFLCDFNDQPRLTEQQANKHEPLHQPLPKPTRSLPDGERYKANAIREWEEEAFYLSDNLSF